MPASPAPRRGSRARRLLIRAAVALLLTTGVGPAPAQTTRHVAICGDDAWTGLSAACAAPGGPKRTIQAAIDASVTGDTILVADGTYTGDGNRDIDFAGRNITLKSMNGPGACILDAEGGYQSGKRLIHFHSGETRDARVEGLTLRDGATSGFGLGAGMLIEQSSPTVVGCVIAENSPCTVCASAPGFGGGVATMGGHPLFMNCSITGNGASIGGGGAAVFGDATFIDCQFIDNAAHSSIGGFYARDGAIILERCTFHGNSVYSGGVGGLKFLDARVTILDCAITSNFAETVSALSLEGSTALVVNTVIENNYAGPVPANAIVVLSGDLAMRACTVLNNEMGGIRCGEAAELSLSECLIAGNGRGSFPGYPTGVDAPTATGSIRGCTIARNYGPAAALELSARATVANSIIWGNAGGSLANSLPTLTYCDVSGGYAGAGNIAVDPKFASPGPPPSGLPAYSVRGFRIRPGSPCIDAGSNPQSTPGVTLDLAGNPRFLNDPWTPDTGVGPAPVADMGALEFTGVSCYADCNANGFLGVGDFACFQTKFVHGDPYADCNGDGALTVGDFGCFQTAFVQGCP